MSDYGRGYPNPAVMSSKDIVALFPKAQRNYQSQDVVDPNLMPLEYLMSLYRDIRQPIGVRIEAAKAAAPYLHVRLAPSASDNSGVIKVEVTGGLPEE